MLKCIISTCYLYNLRNRVFPFHTTEQNISMHVSSVQYPHRPCFSLPVSQNPGTDDRLPLRLPSRCIGYNIVTVFLPDIRLFP